MDRRRAAHHGAATTRGRGHVQQGGGGASLRRSLQRCSRPDQTVDTSTFYDPNQPRGTYAEWPLSFNDPQVNAGATGEPQDRTVELVVAEPR